MANSKIYVNLFYDLGENNFKIKTNLRKEKIDEFLAECYRSTQLISKSYSKYFHPRKIYSIEIDFDSSQIFKISSNTGNNAWTFELIKNAINNWKILSDKLFLDKKGIEKILEKNLN